MAMIQCSECNKEISDKAPACIGCGCPIEHKEKCKDCGCELDGLEKLCQNCGCPVDFFTDTIVNKDFEKRINLYLCNGYKMITQSDNHVELSKQSIFKYIFFTLIFPIIAGVFGYNIWWGSMYKNSDIRQTFEAAKQAIDTQMGITFFIIAVIIGICVLIATKRNNQAIIRITKNGKIEETGNILGTSFVTVCPAIRKRK